MFMFGNKAFTGVSSPRREARSNVSNTTVAGVVGVGRVGVAGVVEVGVAEGGRDPRLARVRYFGCLNLWGSTENSSLVKQYLILES